LPASASAQAKDKECLEDFYPEDAPEQPALQLHLDSAGLEVTPTPESQQTTQRSRGAKAGIAVGVILGVGLVGFGIGAVVVMSNWEFGL
jgi:hypothetical protein